MLTLIVIYDTTKVLVFCFDLLVYAGLNLLSVQKFVESLMMLSS